MVVSRYVPLPIKLKCIFGRALVMGAFWILTVDALILKYMIPTANMLEPFYFSSELEEVETRISDVVQTNVSEGGSKNSPGRPVYEYKYQYDVKGESYSGSSYSSGFSGVQGQSVVVEYPISYPDQSRIVGLRGGVIHWGIGWGTLTTLPLGLVLLFFGLRKGLRTALLLQQGVLTKGRLINQRATGTRINNQPVIEYTFEFAARDGRKYQVSEKTHQGAHLTDEAEEALLYDPDFPEKATLTDNLPGRPKVDPAGNFQGSGVGGFTALIPPIVCALAYYFCFATDRVTF